jgi:hypothetical protein
MLDLGGRDPHSTDLDQVVDAAAVPEEALAVALEEVTGPDRVAAERVLRLLVVSPVEERGRLAGDEQLAVLARHHGIPLYVVAPTSTVDLDCATGAGIPIEERAGAEISDRFPARNPAFDVTPAALISAIVTEHGVHRAPYAEAFAVRA